MAGALGFKLSDPLDFTLAVDTMNCLAAAGCMAVLYWIIPQVTSSWKLTISRLQSARLRGRFADSFHASLRLYPGQHAHTICQTVPRRVPDANFTNFLLFPRLFLVIQWLSVRTHLHFRFLAVRFHLRFIRH